MAMFSYLIHSGQAAHACGKMILVDFGQVHLFVCADVTSTETSTGFELYCFFLSWQSSVRAGFQCRTRPALAASAKFFISAI